MFVAGGMWGTRGHLGSCRHICAQPRQELLKLVLMAREVIWNQKQYVEWWGGACECSEGQGHVPSDGFCWPPLPGTLESHLDMPSQGWLSPALGMPGHNASRSSHGGFPSRVRHFQVPVHGHQPHVSLELHLGSWRKQGKEFPKQTSLRTLSCERDQNDASGNHRKLTTNKNI